MFLAKSRRYFKTSSDYSTGNSMMMNLRHPYHSGGISLFKAPELD